MNQELTSNTSSDFTVNPTTGEAFISRARLAVLLNVSPNTLKSHILRRGEADLNQPLTAESMQSCAAYFAYESSVKTPEAKAFLNKLLEAGAKAYIYHEAGYQISASEPKQELTLTESLKAMVAVSEAMDAFKAKQALMQKEIDEKATKEALAKLQRSFEGNQCPRGYLPKYKLATYFDLPVTHFTDEFLGSVCQVTYPFSSGMGGLRTAVAYKLTDVMDLLGITE